VKLPRQTRNCQATWKLPGNLAILRQFGNRRAGILYKYTDSYVQEKLPGKKAIAWQFGKPGKLANQWQIDHTIAITSKIYYDLLRWP